MHKCRAVRRGVTLFDRVEQTELDRIHAQLVRECVHVLPEGKLKLRQTTAVMKVVRQMIGMREPPPVARGLERVQRMQILAEVRSVTIICDST